MKRIAIHVGWIATTWMVTDPVTHDDQLRIHHWNKNHKHMICSGSQYFYKHKHFHSYTTNHSKRGALIGTWTRMQDNTMDDSHLQTCIQEKMLELSTLSYPHKYVQHTLQYMHKKTGNRAWLAF